MPIIRHSLVTMMIVLFGVCSLGYAQLIVPLGEYSGQQLPVWRSVHSTNVSVQLEPVQPPAMQMQAQRLDVGGGWIYPELSFAQPIDLSMVKAFVVGVSTSDQGFAPVIKIHLKDVNGNSCYTKNGVQFTQQNQTLVFSHEDLELKTDQQVDLKHIASMTLGYSISPDDQPLAYLAVDGIQVDIVPPVTLDYDAFVFPGNINVFTASQTVSFDCLANGDLSILNGQGQAIRQLNLSYPKNVDLGVMPTGYYRIKAADYLNYFIVVAEADDYPQQTGNVFGVDYGMATSPSWEKSEAQRAATMAQMAGLDYVRERLNLVGIFESHDLDHLTASPWFIKTRDTYQANTEAGLKVVAKFLQTPERLRADGNILKVADDLFEFERMLTLLDEQLHPWIDTWEIFNEINLQNFYAGTAWEYAAMQKVAYLTLKKRSPQKLVVGPSYSQPAPYLRDVLHRNGMDEYYDVANFHTYADVQAALGYTESFINSTDAITQSVMPVWCTETGIITDGLYAHDTSQQAVDQLHHHATLVGPLMTNINAAGAEKVMYFYWKSVFTFLSVLDHKFMATECYAAIATLNRMLGGQYVGTHHYSNDIWAHRYDTSHGPRLIVCSKNYPVTVTLQLQGNYQVVSMTGATIASGNATNGILNLSLPSEAVYVAAEQLTDTFTTDVQNYTPQQTMQSELVIDVRLDPEAKYNTPFATLDLEPGHQYNGLVHIYNFSDVPFSGQLAISDTGAWQIQVAQPAFTVMPHEKYTTSIQITAPGSIESGIQTTDVQLSIPGSTSIASLRLSLDRMYLPPQEVHPLFDSLAELNWTVAADSAHQTETFQSLGEQGSLFRVDFLEDGHRMFWPVLKSFPNGVQLLDLSQYDAISFDVDILQARPGTWYMCTLVEENGARYGSSTRIYCDEPGRYKMIFPFEGFVYLSNFSTFDGPLFHLDLDKIKSIGLGLNTKLNVYDNQHQQYSVEYIIDGITLIKY